MSGDAQRLTHKQRAFVREYLVDRNGAAAARRAGYSGKTANRQASDLLSKPDIRAAIATGEAEHAQRTIVTRDWVVQRLVGVADRAQTAGALQAERAALDSLAKLHGFVVEKRDMRVITSWQDLSDEELRALAGPEPPGEDSANGQS